MFDDSVLGLPHDLRENKKIMNRHKFNAKIGIYLIFPNFSSGVNDE